METIKVGGRKMKHILAARAAVLFTFILGLVLLIPVVSVAVTFTWNEPTKNTDGSTLTCCNINLNDLSGYRFYWTKDSTNPKQNTVDVGRPASCETFPSVSKCSYKLDLADGTWEVRVTAYNKGGNEGPFSNVVTKVLFTICPESPINLK